LEKFFPDSENRSLYPTMIYAKTEYIYSVFSLDSYNDSMHS